MDYDISIREHGISNLVIEQVTADILDEWYKATTKLFPKFNSGHEGYAVILEELDELWLEVQANKGDPRERNAKMYKEAKQVAAMAIRFMIDVCKIPD